MLTLRYAAGQIESDNECGSGCLLDITCIGDLTREDKDMCWGLLLLVMSTLGRNLPARKAAAGK